jgi:hypothetical protein
VSNQAVADLCGLSKPHVARLAAELAGDLKALVRQIQQQTASL